MNSVNEIISDEEIENVHGDSDFNSMSKREVVNQALLKCASGFYQGHTSKQIIMKHGLTDDNYELTQKGKEYLWQAFKTDISV